ncbi:amino acid/polyamine/organocation transporter (APC superfamily) [Stackebrandtia endophytica]|uniref:Amino acid/polyamine/organocation transporter (APC superfamily) n=1 Tax=Stackebrandtia endophytica TaxID=1496996 RepID=A0A543ATA0_9ACTN|nr:APC family permease [Stackebrandtia endophytica]TQL75735.1 amino acid/polyamine/organocation transporter (APC superfamily) [Stackebrandtia endophytica]
MSPDEPRLSRQLNGFDAVVVGLGAMLGAGVFVAMAPASRAAGSALLVALVIAAAIAYCNAMSSARLAARYPSSGGTYVYGRERLGDFWGYLAGWSFVVGKVASCAAMALTVGAYVWPQHARVPAVVVVVLLAAANYFGVRKSVWLTRVLVAVVLIALVVMVVVSVTSDAVQPIAFEFGGERPWGVLEAAGLLFFAFAGYARIATLGEEVRDPAVTIPRAIPSALGITLIVYLAVAVALLAVLGPDRLAATSAPLTDAVRVAGADWLVPIVPIAAALAAIGALLALILGVSRTVLAMARDRHLPRPLAQISRRYQVPQHAEIAVAAVVIGLVLTTDLHGAIGFSSFGVLIYYAIANASAWTLDSSASTRVIPAIGLVGCLMLAVMLPTSSVVTGVLVAVVGVLSYHLRRRFGGGRD